MRRFQDCVWSGDACYAKHGDTFVLCMYGHTLKERKDKWARVIAGEMALEAIQAFKHTYGVGKLTGLMIAALDALPKDEPTPKSDIKFDLLALRTEVNCRIEHGAEAQVGLQYVQDALDRMIREQGDD